MKKTLIVTTIIAFGFLSSGCATWEGVKKDTSNAWNSTKRAVHEATE